MNSKKKYEVDHLADGTETVTLTSSKGSSSGQVFTISNPTFSNITLSQPQVLTTTGYPYSVGTGVSWEPKSTSSKIRLDGEGADIEVNGESLIGMIKKIEERLNILHPNEKLEAEWAELRELGDQYRKLEQHIKDKQATWDRLTAVRK